MDNQDISSVPPWLNRTFFEETLRLKYPNSVLSRFDISPAVDFGSHFCSELYKVKADMKEENSNGEVTLHLIVKILPQQEVRRHHIEEAGIFNKESTMYSKVLPVMDKLLSQAYEKEGHLSPEYFKTSGKFDSDVIILENVSYQGFKGLDPMKGLNKEQCKMVLKTIAHFHASSVKISEDQPQLIHPFSFGPFNKKSEGALQEIYGGVLSSLADIVQEWGEVDKKFSKEIRAMSKTAVSKMLEITKSEESDFRVLIHGDLWTTNLLFKINDGDLEVKLIDFQQSHFTSPMVELQYFFHTALLSKIRDGNIDEFLEYYHKELIKTLNLLGSKVSVTLEELKEKYKEKAFIGLFAACTDLFLSMTDGNSVIDEILENNANGNSETELCNSIYKEELLRLLPYFEKNGLFS